MSRRLWKVFPHLQSEGQGVMNKKENFDCPHCGQDLRLSPNAEDEIDIARDEGFAKGFADARKEISVCDCHTWPTIEEMHDYCVALEKENKQSEILVKALKKIAVPVSFSFNSEIPIDFYLNVRETLRKEAEEALRQYSDKDGGGE